MNSRNLIRTMVLALCVFLSINWPSAFARAPSDAEGSGLPADTRGGGAPTEALADADALAALLISACKSGDFITAYRYLEDAREKKALPEKKLAALKVLLLQQMGSPAAAQAYAWESGVEEVDLMGSVRGDVAAQRIRWEEFDDATRILEEQLAEDPANERARFDYMIALARAGRMQEVLDQYKIVQKAGLDTPHWVTEVVADAYAQTRKPKKAEEFYYKLLLQNPDAPFKAYIGLYESFTVQREWAKADAIWQDIENMIDKGALNWMEHHEALTAKGWLLIGQDRLAEARDYFDSLLGEAGLDPGFRSGLAHSLYHRGRPTAALEQLKAALNVEPGNVITRVSMVETLEELDRKREARMLASELYRTYPYDFLVKDAYEALRAKDRPFFAAEGRLIDEAPGSTEYRFQFMGGVSIVPELKIFADIMHMDSYERTQGERFTETWDRAGVGFSWLIVPRLTFTESGSWDYSAKTDFGSFTKLEWRVNDAFRVAGAYESFSLDIPIRARAVGVKGKTALADLYYTEKDVRDYHAILQWNWLNDGNSIPSAVIGFEQTLISRPGWKFRLGPELYYARYSKNQNTVNYFSPPFEASLVLRPDLQIVHSETYDRKFISHIYADVGAYKQQGFNVYAIGGFSYEQELVFSRTFSLRWMAGYGARVYNGGYSNVLELFLSLSKTF